MKETIMGIVGGMGLLIFSYLVLSHGTESIGILNGTLGGSTSMVKTLQGR